MAVADVGILRPDVRRIAARFARGGRFVLGRCEVEDLVQVGLEGAHRASLEWRDDGGASWRGYCLDRARGYIRHYLRDLLRLLRVPASAQARGECGDPAVLASEWYVDVEADGSWEDQLSDGEARYIAWLVEQRREHLSRRQLAHRKRARWRYRRGIWYRRCSRCKAMLPLSAYHVLTRKVNAPRERRYMMPNSFCKQCGGPHVAEVRAQCAA